MDYRHILVVDDDADDAEIFVMAIKAIDPSINCSRENNALQALKKLSSAQKLPDIIFLDFHLPYLDEHKFLKLIRDAKGLKKIPVVLYSGHSDSTISGLTKNFKSLVFLEKPNNFRDIIESLRMILGYDQLVAK